MTELTMVELTVVELTMMLTMVLVMEVEILVIERVVHVMTILLAVVITIVKAIVTVLVVVVVVLWSLVLFWLTSWLWLVFLRSLGLVLWRGSLSWHFLASLWLGCWSWRHGGWWLDQVKIWLLWLLWLLGNWLFGGASQVSWEVDIEFDISAFVIIVSLHSQFKVLVDVKVHIV